MHMMVQNPEGITVYILIIIIENNFCVHDAFFYKAWVESMADAGANQ